MHPRNENDQDAFDQNDREDCPLPRVVNYRMSLI